MSTTSSKCTLETPWEECDEGQRTALYQLATSMNNALRERVRVLEATQLELQHNVMAIRKDERAASERANMLEAVALQGAEERDALRERIRVLERESLTHLIDSLVGVGNSVDVSDMLRIGLRAIGCSQFAHLSRHVPGGCAEIIAKAIADAEKNK